MSDRARTHVHVLRVYRYRRSNNGAVMRLPFFRDNQWGAPFSKGCPHHDSKHGAPCRLKGQSPSYLRFGRLSFSRPFARPSPFFRFFPLSPRAPPPPPPYTRGPHVEAVETGNPCATVENPREIATTPRVGFSIVARAPSTPTDEFFGGFPRGSINFRGPP